MLCKNLTARLCESSMSRLVEIIISTANFGGILIVKYRVLPHVFTRVEMNFYI